MSEIETAPSGFRMDPAKLAAGIGALVSRLYAYARHDVAAIYKGGWRPLLGFTGIYIAHFAYVVAPSKGIALDYTSVNVFLGMVFIQALGRGLEKAMADRVAPAG